MRIVEDSFHQLTNWDQKWRKQAWRQTQEIALEARAGFLWGYDGKVISEAKGKKKCAKEEGNLAVKAAEQGELWSNVAYVEQIPVLLTWS